MPQTLAQTDAGSLDTRVVFERPTQVTRDAGDVAQVWEEDFRAWAEIIPQTGREPLIARRFEGEITHVVRCRARRDKGVGTEGGIGFDWRIRLPPRRAGDVDRYFEIDHILDSYEHGVVWMIRCVERPDRASDPPTSAGGPL